MHQPSFVRSAASTLIACVAVLAFDAAPTGAQVVERPDANPEAVQADRADVPDGTIEIVLTPRARRALAEGRGWQALGSGLEARFAGARAGAEGSAGIPAVVHAAVMNRDGRVLKHHRSDPMVVGPDGTRSLDRVAALGAEWRLPEIPAAAYFPIDTYFPSDTYFPGDMWLPSPAWDSKHGVVAGDGPRHEKRGVGINPGRFDERDVGIDPGRVDERDDGIDPGRVEKRDVGIDPGRFLVITVVPADADAREVIEVRPLIVDLDPKGRTADPTRAPSDKPDW